MHNHLRRAAARLDLPLDDSEQDDYARLLAEFERSLRAVVDQPDHLPPPDPRPVGSHAPDDNAWATKATVKGAESGILASKTLALKDTICLAGIPCKNGTDVVSGFIPSVDATVVSRSLDAGALILGKATCEDFSHGTASNSSPGPPIENPHAHGFSCGGSSSGCGALLARGEVDVAIGGDQGGSIRIPAAFCGVVGLKPTFGLVPYTGILSSESALDHAGPMARTVHDTALLLEAIAGYDGIDDRQLGAPTRRLVPKYSSVLLSARESHPQLPLTGTRIGVLKQGLDTPRLQPAVSALFSLALDRLRALGAEVNELSIPAHTHATSALSVLNKLGSAPTRAGRQTSRRGLYLTEFYDRLLPWTSEKWARAHTFVKNTALCAEYGWEQYPSAYGRAMNQVRVLKDAYDRVLEGEADGEEGYDVLVMPTVPFTARRHSREGASVRETHETYAGIVINTSQFNGTGHPALSLPIGLAPPTDDLILSPGDSQIRLPVGMQVVGRMFDEATVLRVADALERARDWREIEAGFDN